ncbi:unnamed protein product [Cuscuta epithymum]|uniref:BED-type domain-containing protein n=1 Tax=Cuscuta epithymum TaxID=186058 RepID=A0AAV0F9E5_9ASTE|nr:unnamed protein product [Cuscuta epithymum]
MMWRCPTTNYKTYCPKMIHALHKNNNSRQPLTKMSSRMRMRRRTGGGGGGGDDGTPDDEQELEDEGGSSQIGNKSKYPIIENNFTKRKDKNTDKWYASCNHCNKKYSLGTSGGYGSLTRHPKSAHLVKYAKIDKGKGKQTQISRFANSQPFGNFSYDDKKTFDWYVSFNC